MKTQLIILLTILLAFAACKKKEAPVDLRDGIAGSYYGMMYQGYTPEGDSTPTLSTEQTYLLHVTKMEDEHTLKFAVIEPYNVEEDNYTFSYAAGNVYESGDVTFTFTPGADSVHVAYKTTPEIERYYNGKR